MLDGVEGSEQGLAGRAVRIARRGFVMTASDVMRAGA